MSTGTSVEAKRTIVDSEWVTATSAWRKRVLVVGGGFQVAFGALWLTRGLLPLARLPIALAVGTLVLVAGMIAAFGLRRFGTRPQGPKARIIERRLTIATVLQLAASIVVPITIASAAGHRLVLPSIVFTIGVLLVWIHREVQTPYQGVAGWLLVGLAAVSGLMTGSAQVVTIGLTSAIILLGCASAGFLWLRLSN